MKRKYNFDELADKYGFSIREIEKVCRISDQLEDISAIKFLRDHLSLYGGTALTFIYFEEIKRLSIDIDLNYRHQNARDWGKVRDEIDESIKDVLYRKGYNESDIAISPTYPLVRLTVRYTNSLGSKDNFEIEIGYMRRIPILKTDATATFLHIGTQESFPIKTPIKEELFANKMCTLLYRGTPRDLFDVYQISTMNIDREIFRKCAIVDSLMRGKPRLHKINLKDTIERIPLDSSLTNMLQTENLEQLNFNELRNQTLAFCREILADLETNEIKAIDRFFDLKKFEPDMIDEQNIFHDKLKDHPAIKWALNKLV